MNVNQLGKLAVAVAALLVTLFAGSAIAANQNEVKTGKKATVALSATAQVGDITLQAGEYVFQHVVSAGQHFATFTGPKGKASATQKVTCTNEQLKQRVAQTSVTMENIRGINKITRIEIAGENVAHVF
jgi:hypothetical protein